MRHYQSPTRYYLQYLLIPIRLLLFLPLFACLIILNLLAQTILAVIGLIATGVLVGSGWLIDTYIWHGFSKSPIAALLAVLLIYPTYNGVGYCIGKIIEQFAWMPGLKEFSASLSEKIGNWWDRAVTFVFEAKYKQSPLDIYGPDFPEPTFAEFNLDKEEYYAYNRRFSLEGFEFSIAVFAGILTGWYLRASIGFAVAVSMFLIVFAFERWLRRLKPQYRKVQEYQRAKDIYQTIQKELHDARAKAQFDKKWEEKVNRLYK